MKKILAITYLLTSLFCSITAYSANSSFIVHHYTVEDGLPNNIVNCSIKTHDGFMWFGTWFGLCRFDGIKFHNFSNPYTINSDQSPRKVETIVEDGEGNIWLKTLDWKLSVFFKKAERFENIFDELKKFSCNLQIIKIQNDGHGNILLLTKDKNLLLANTTKKGDINIRLLATSKGKIDLFNYHLKENLISVKNNYASFVGKDYKLFAIPLNKNNRHKSYSYWKRYFEQCAVKSNIHKDRHGNIWTVVDDAALTYYNPKTKFSKRFPFSLFGRITNPSFCDAGEHGIFYLTSAGEAIHIDIHTMEASRVSMLPEFADNEKDSRYFSMNIDKNGILWLTTTNNGFYRLSFPSSQFKVITLPKTDNEGVRSLFQNTNGDVWVGTRSKNLYILDANGKMKANLSYDKFKIGSVYSIIKDHKQRLWLSTKGDGLVEAIPDKSQPYGYKFIHFRHDASNKKSISGNNVYVAYEDSHKRIWVGTLDGGLNLINEKNGKLEFLNKFNSMAGYPGYGLYMEVRNMVEDKYGRMWIGTIDGLMSFKNNFKHVSDIKFDNYRYTEINTLANSDIYALYKDYQQNIWVCTFGGGLSRIVGFDKDTHLPKFETIGMKEGLKNDVIISILEDKTGQLWLGNTYGLSCFNRTTDRIRNFDRTDGFPLVTMEETASLLNKNGEVWMGCKEGIVVFHPDKLKRSTTDYPVYIVGVSVNNQDIHLLPGAPILQESATYSDNLELKYDQNMFTLEFAALNYERQDNITYRHKLEGFDKDWHYDGSNRLASYTNVPPGEYTLKVEAYDTMNPGKPSSLSYSITILPPWWATWWAYTIYSILFIITAIAVARYVKYQIKLKNNVYIQTKISEYKRQYELEQKDASFLKTVNETIDANISKPDFELDVIANELGMSRSAFFKRIKVITNLSPSEYVKEYKLNKAVDLLKNSNMNITDIAYMSGFSEVGYFGKCFRKKYGMSPRDFKKQ